MNFKSVFYVFVLIVQVRSDCDGYFEYLGDFVQDYLGGKNGAENRSDVNDTEFIDVDSLRNKSVNLFDLSDIGKSLSQALTDVTTLIKDEIKGMFSIQDQTDVYKEIENKTEIHVRAFSLSKINENVTDKNVSRETESSIRIPDIIINNLTKFNDELNALKVEIERNLQAELESFISQVLENDTVDWIDNTENSLLDAEFSTTIKPYPDLENDVETTTQLINDNIDDTDFIFTDNVVNTIMNSIKASNESRSRQTENPISSETADNNKTKTTISVPTLISDAAKTTAALTTKGPDSVSTKSSAVITSERNVKLIEPVLKNTDTNKTLPPITTTSAVLSTTKITTTVKAVKIDGINATTISPVTVKTTNHESDKKHNINEVKQESRTKAPIDFKTIENVAENEISNEDTLYYDIQDDNVTDYPIIDYVDLYKDTTNEDVDYIPTVKPDSSKNDEENVIQNGDANNGFYTNDTTHPASIFPGIAAIFIKNGTDNQFNYYCDGILLTESIVLTAARCLQRSNVTVDADDVIIFLGKRSLQYSSDGETINKVKQLKLHSNFTLKGDAAQNDLAALYLEEPAVLSESIRPACLVTDDENGDAVTTAWSESLAVVSFDKKNAMCDREIVDNTFCATYGLTVALCPSYGGVYAAKQSESWCVAGVRTADPSTRGLCFDKTVRYTDIRKYRQWIDEIMK